jgi:chromate transporter
MKMTKNPNRQKYRFLFDVLLYTLTAFGGAQAHVGIMLKNFVQKRDYITEKELLELNALSQILPGPSSTQTLIGIAFKVGGVPLAIVTFLIWVLPSAILMSVIAISYNTLNEEERFDHIMEFVQPIAVGIVAYSAYTFSKSVLQSRTAVWLAAISVITTLILRNAYVFPLLILMGGIISSALEAPEEETNLRVKLFSNINRNKILYFAGILLTFAALGSIVNQTSSFSLPIRLFENFYRNGIMVFGGGQILVPLMFTEFVEMKQYLSSHEFLSGYAFQQAIPGPMFSFTSFLGATILRNVGYGIPGQIVGSVVAVLGINLPGLILVLFIVPFWNDLKKITRINNSLSGINAVAAGFLIAAFILLLHPLRLNTMSINLILISFLILTFTRINPAFVILGGVLLGYLLY